MSTGELARNPQNLPLHETLQESADLINELAAGGSIFDIPVAGTVYDLYRNFFPHQQPEPGRQKVRLHWKSGDELAISDGRSVTSMVLDVAKNSDAFRSGLAQPYRLACAFDVVDWHEVTITVDNEQRVNIVNEQPQVSTIINRRIEMITPVYWKPISEPDVESILTIFHDTLQAAKLIQEEKKRETREHNKLQEYIKQRRLNGFPDDNSVS